MKSLYQPRAAPDCWTARSEISCRETRKRSHRGDRCHSGLLLPRSSSLVCLQMLIWLGLWFGAVEPSLIPCRTLMTISVISRG